MLEKFVAAQIVVSALLLNVVTAFSLLDIKKVVTTFIHSHPIAVLAFIEILLFGYISAAAGQYLSNLCRYQFGAGGSGAHHQQHAIKQDASIANINKQISCSHHLQKKRRV